MRYLRHAPLALWASVVLVLGAITAAAWYAGHDTTPTVKSYTSPSSERGAALSMLQRVAGVYPSITSDEMAEWATQTSQMAAAGLAGHLRAGGAETDTVALAWIKVRDTAEELSVQDPSDAPSVLEYTARLGQAAQDLVNLVDPYLTTEGAQL